MYILNGSTSKTVAKDLSTITNFPIVQTMIKRFPDGELYIRILDDISGEDLIILQNTYPDQNIIELFLLQDAAKEAGAKKITVIIPYYGYGRQDKKFEKGEPISSKAIAQLISIKADEIITIDPHKEHILNFFSVPSSSGTAVPEIAKYLKRENVDMVLGPDKGALDRVKQASYIIGCDFDFMEKKRISGEKVEIKPKNLDVINKKIAIIDDIISTGGTMSKSIKELKNQGAKQVLVTCTHGLFAGDAIKKLIHSGCDKILSTDTILSKYSKVKIAPCIFNLLKSRLG